MRLFGRKREKDGFWRTPPIPTGDPAVMQQYGTKCFTQSDGQGMIAAGWALWQMVGLHQFQASTLITDGYHEWIGADRLDDGTRLAFLIDLFDSLAPSNASSPHEAEPVAVLHEMRCWAGAELVGCLAQSVDQRKDDYERRVYQAISGTPPALVPARSVGFARSYASANGLPDPFCSG